MDIEVEIKKVCWKHAEAVCNSKLIELGYDDFEHTRVKRLIRDKKLDLFVIKGKLK